MTVQVKVRVEARAAILARKSIAGVIPVEVTEQDLNALDDAQLAELADIVDRGEILESPLVSAPTFEVVRAVVDERIKTKAAIVEAAKAAEDARRKSEARATEEEIVRKRTNVHRDAEHKKAVAAWLDEHGEDELKERYVAGFLSDDEIMDEALHKIFEINEDEHVPLRKEQACDCDKGCTGSVRFSVQAITPGVTPLDSRQYATLDRIQSAAPDKASVEVRTHKGSCPECKCTPIARLAARVCLEWNGYLLVKEYSLG